MDEKAKSVRKGERGEYTHKTGLSNIYAQKLNLIKPYEDQYAIDEDWRDI